MATTDKRPSVGELRRAIAQGVSGTSLRQVARDVGMSPSGLSKFLDGSKPHANTQKKLERWYVRGGEGEVGLEVAKSALGVLVSTLPPDRRREAMIDLLDALDAAHSQANRSKPVWLRALRDSLSQRPD